MRTWRGVVCLLAGAALAVACSAASRHKTLTFFFDGVPPLQENQPTPGEGQEETSQAAGRRRTGYTEHGPYAAKLCGACHQAGSTNALVASKDELCFRCHQLTLDKPYVHGPLASGGCLGCHDPHNSKYRSLLHSDSDSFCLQCHAPESIAKVEAHQGTGANCTECHDAHMSDNKYLLK